jgi:hypothetical protein
MSNRDSASATPLPRSFPQPGRRHPAPALRVHRAAPAPTTFSSSDTSQTSNELAILKRIMDLMQAYASNDANSSSLLGTLSVSA